MKQRGSLTLGLGITIGVLSLMLAGTGWLYNGALKEKARVQGEYEAFKDGVARLGKEAENKRLNELERQKRSHDETIKSLEKRLASARARADELCKSAGLSAGCRTLPAVPPTTRPVDDATRDQRLLAVLQHAQDTTDRLIELQAWITEQQAVHSRAGPSVPVMMLVLPSGI